MGVRDRLGEVARWKIVLALLVGVAAVVLVYPVVRPYLQLFYDPERLRAFVQGFGVLAPLAMIGIQVSQVLFAPVPGQVVGVVAGLTFGVVWGTTLVMVGAGIGTFLGIFIAKRYGRPAVERFVEDETLERFDGLAEEYGMLPFALLILLPGFPDDAICLIAGLSELDFKWLVIWGTVLRLPGFLALAMTGDTLAVHGVKWFIVAVAILAAVSLALFYKRDRIMAYGQKWA
jgi:uncharacterized membrane protein YdjX (TVP38/TMEM64 family)